MTGLNLDLAHWITNEYNRRVRAGEILEANALYNGFIHGFPVMFSPLLKEHYSEHLGWALWFYGGNTFNVFQLICPDKEGRWPWDEGLTDKYRWLMPMLSEAPMRGAGPAEEHRAC